MLICFVAAVKYSQLVLVFSIGRYWTLFAIILGFIVVPTHILTATLIVNITILLVGLAAIPNSPTLMIAATVVIGTMLSN